MKDHKDLDVWRQAMQLAEDVYTLTKCFPADEKFGLVSQIKRAAVSVPSNVAEGAGRNSSKEFIHFLYISLGSLAELETQLLLSHRLNIIEFIDDFLKQIEKIKQMLYGLIRHLKIKINQ